MIIALLKNALCFHCLLVIRFRVWVCSKLFQISNAIWWFRDRQPNSEIQLPLRQWLVIKLNGKNGILILSKRTLKTFSMNQCSPATVRWASRRVTITIFCKRNEWDFEPVFLKRELPFLLLCLSYGFLKLRLVCKFNSVYNNESNVST